MREEKTRIQLVAGISGVALPSAAVDVNWNAMRIEGLMIFAASGLPADTAGLAISIIDENAETLFQATADGSLFVPALALVGVGPSIYFPGAPRWFRMCREVQAGDRWKIAVTGAGGVVPIVAFMVTPIENVPRAAA